jgi:hypothetical protein
MLLIADSCATARRGLWRSLVRRIVEIWDSMPIIESFNSRLAIARSVVSAIQYECVYIFRMTCGSSLLEVMVGLVWSVLDVNIMHSTLCTTIFFQLRHLDDVFDVEHVDFLHQPSMFFGDFNIVVPDNVTVQPNGFDCGIYVIHNMQYYGTNWWAEVTF